MLTLFLGALLGLLAGMLSMLPGVHVTILLIGLLPLLHVNGPVGAVAMVTALVSGLVSSNLAKTFHPATAETIKSATPEQLMAYQGNGFKAVAIQHQAVWSGVVVVLLIAVPTLILKQFIGDDLKGITEGITKPFAPWLLALFIGGVICLSKKKIATLAVIIAATGLGFFAMNTPALAGNPNTLAPLLGGPTIAVLLMVAFHKGSVRLFPKQRTSRWKPKPDPKHITGALGGIATALAAGLGAGAIVSTFAGKVSHEDYLGMHTASEASNHVFAVLLLLLIGTTHSGVGVALKQQLVNPDLMLCAFLLLAILLTLFISTILAHKILPIYSNVIGKVPQRGMAIFVGLVTMSLIFSETGLVGCAIAVAAAALGYAAKVNWVPNQAMVTVLAGPVLVYYLGLSRPLAMVLGVMH